MLFTPEPEVDFFSIKYRNSNRFVQIMIWYFRNASTWRWVNINMITWVSESYQDELYIFGYYRDLFRNVKLTQNTTINARFYNSR